MNTYEVIEILFTGKRYRPNDEQRKTEHGLIQLKSEDANTTNTSESVSPPSTAQDESSEADTIIDAGGKHDVGKSNSGVKLFFPMLNIEIISHFSNVIGMKMILIFIVT